MTVLWRMEKIPHRGTTLNASGMLDEVRLYTCSRRMEIEPRRDGELLANASVYNASNGLLVTDVAVRGADFDVADNECTQR
jgi:hypothetical protein